MIFQTVFQKEKPGGGERVSQVGERYEQVWRMVWMRALPRDLGGEGEEKQGRGAGREGGGQLL